MCALQMRIRLAEYVKRDVVSFDPPVQDRFLGRCIWWKPEPDSVWYKGTITSKDLGHGGEILYHVCYEDGDEADLETHMSWMTQMSILLHHLISQLRYYCNVLYS